MSGFTSRLRHVLAVGLIAGGCVTCTLFASPTQANVWLAHRFDSNAYVRSIAVHDDSFTGPSLTVNFTNRPAVFGIRPGLGHIPDYKPLSYSDSPFPMEMKAQPNGGLLGFFGHKNSVKITNTLGIPIGTLIWNTILSKGGRLLSNDLSVQITATTIAVNGKGDVFVGGYRSENIDQESSDPSSASNSDNSNSDNSDSDSSSSNYSAASVVAIDPNRHKNYPLSPYRPNSVPANVTGAKPKSYFVYQLVQDNLDAWHVQPLAFGATPPRLVSSASDQIVLVSDPGESFQLMEGGKSKLHQRTLGPLPEGNKRLILDSVRSRTMAFHGTDDSIVVADDINDRIWRFAANGSNAVTITGGGGPRDVRQTNPAMFNFRPGPIAPAPEGGFFVGDSEKTILFFGPEDRFEQRLATLVKEAEQLLRFGDGKDDIEQARIKVKVLKQLAFAEHSDGAANTSTPMERVRARMALNTLRERIGTDWFSRLEREEQPQPAASTLPAVAEASSSSLAHGANAHVHCPCPACSPSAADALAPPPFAQVTKPPSLVNTTASNWGEFNSSRSDGANRPRHRGPAGPTKNQPPKNKKKKKSKQKKKCCCSCVGKAKD